MCGINGIIYFNNSFKNESAAFFESKMSVMNKEIAHRGPDGEGIFCSYPVSFGHKRLSIIDLSENASQPMFNDDRSVVIVFNGEIYNYIELMSELTSRGHKFRTQSDTEVIIHSYEEFGFDCVNRFNGMWAFTVYDFRKNIFFASRDRFGVKPFYYYIDKEYLVFSSEIKSILKIKDVRNANRGKVFDYLAYGYKTGNGETFFSGINELKPAHNLIIRNDVPKFERYWDLNISKRRSADNINELYEETDNLIKDAVKIRFRSDVPVSILLSGGLDSGIITKITDEQIDSHELKEKNVTAFSAVFPGFIDDESVQVKEFLKTCRHINSVLMSPDQDTLIGSIDNFVYGMGEPVFSTSSFAHYSLMKEMKRNNVKVVLNGQGADEAWCGYGKYIIGYFILDLLFSKPFELPSQIFSISRNMGLSYKYIFKQIIKSAVSRKLSSKIRSRYQEKIYDCLSDEFRQSENNYLRNPEYGKLSSENLSGFLKYNIQYLGFNQILNYEDHSSMQSSVEMRSPFIDYRLMELAFSLPPETKFDHGITKKILREIYKSKLPDSIISNKKKIGFMTPFNDWMNKKVTENFIRDLLNSDSFRSKSIWDASKIKNIFENKEKYTDFPFWRVINLELWSRAYGINNL